MTDDAAPSAATTAAPSRGSVAGALGLFLAVMLALLGVLGALVAWRMAAAGGTAAGATHEAVLAQGRLGGAEVSASISALDGFAAWEDYETARYRGAALFNAEAYAESLRAYGEAAAHWAGVPASFLDPDGDYEPDTFRAALVAASVAADTTPGEHIARAVVAEARAANLGSAGLVLALALPLLTAAEVVTRRRPRQLLAAAGTVVVAAGLLLLVVAWG